MASGAWFLDCSGLSFTERVVELKENTSIEGRKANNEKVSGGTIAGVF
jgi:hypothetical protein